MKRPLALRCGTTCIQPHELHTVVERYLDGTVDSPSHSLFLLLSDDRSWSLSTLLQLRSYGASSSVVLMSGLTHPFAFSAFAILWLAMKGEDVTDPVADTLECAAGLAKQQKCGVILPNCAESLASLIKPSLGFDIRSLSGKTCKDGSMDDTCLMRRPCKKGSSLSWDVPKSNMHAISDIAAMVQSE